MRWNFGAAVIDAAGWGLGMGIIAYSTILPLFVGHLTRSPLAVGLIQAVMHCGWLLPGILVAGWWERMPRVKRPLMVIAGLERVQLLLIAPLCLWLGPRHPEWLLFAFFLSWAVMNGAIGANMPGYYKLIAKTIPADLRGRLYGIGGAASGLLGMLSVIPASYFLREWGFPAGFAACFVTAFCVHTLTVLPLAFIREPVQPLEATPTTTTRSVMRLIRDDRRMTWISIAVALSSVNGIAGAFFAIHAMQRFQAPDELIVGFTTVVMGAKTVAFLLAGWLGDRHGNRTALIVATLAGTAGALAATGPSLAWLYVAFALNELSVQGWGVCSQNYVLELCPPERASSYTAAFGLYTGPFRVLAPLAAGALATVTGYGPVFILAALGGVATLAILITRLEEPRRLAAPTAG